MERERAKEILTDVLRTINSEEQEFNISTEIGVIILKKILNNYGSSYR